MKSQVHRRARSAESHAVRHEADPRRSVPARLRSKTLKKDAHPATNCGTNIPSVPIKSWESRDRTHS